MPSTCYAGLGERASRGSGVVQLVVSLRPDRSCQLACCWHLGSTARTPGLSPDIDTLLLGGTWRVHCGPGRYDPSK